jgi:hypothetical protein
MHEGRQLAYVVEDGEGDEGNDHHKRGLVDAFFHVDVA